MKLPHCSREKAKEIRKQGESKDIWEHKTNPNQFVFPGDLKTPFISIRIFTDLPKSFQLIK